jgi:hypothetical protein
MAAVDGPGRGRARGWRRAVRKAQCSHGFLPDPGEGEGMRRSAQTGVPATVRPLGMTLRKAPQRPAST